VLVDAPDKKVHMLDRQTLQMIGELPDLDGE
jgi:hypothetical protein